MQSLGFALFVAVTCVLFLRPADLFVSLADWPGYEIVILPCLIVLLPRVLDLLHPQALKSRPETVCVFGLLLAAPLSYIGRLELSPAPEVAIAFSKIVVSYV